MRAFEFPIKNYMSPSGIRTPPIYRNRWYLTSEVEALNRDFEYTYSAAPN